MRYLIVLFLLTIGCGQPNVTSPLQTKTTIPQRNGYRPECTPLKDAYMVCGKSHIIEVVNN
jgi:hypothetical protein